MKDKEFTKQQIIQSTIAKTMNEQMQNAMLECQVKQYYTLIIPQIIDKIKMIEELEAK